MGKPATPPHPKWPQIRRWAERLGLAACCSFLHGCTDPEASPPDLTSQRKAMIKDHLEARGISDPVTLSAMRAVPRHEFVPARLRDEAYADYPLPIGHGQTISQPYIVAFMTEAIRPRPGEKILEIGAGSGYQAAVLAQAGAEVYTVEIVPPLAELARHNLARLGFRNAHVLAGDGYRGWPEHAPFDAIIVTCAPDRIPPDLIAQLRDGGRMIIPVGGGMNQDLILLRKHGDQIEQQAVLPVRFVPMTGEAARVH